MLVLGLDQLVDRDNWLGQCNVIIMSRTVFSTGKLLKRWACQIRFWCQILKVPPPCCPHSTHRIPLVYLPRIGCIVYFCKELLSKKSSWSGFLTERLLKFRKTLPSILEFQRLIINTSSYVFPVICTASGQIWHVDIIVHYLRVPAQANDYAVFLTRSWACSKVIIWFLNSQLGLNTPCPKTTVITPELPKTLVLRYRGWYGEQP